MHCLRKKNLIVTRAKWILHAKYCQVCLQQCYMWHGVISNKIKILGEKMNYWSSKSWQTLLCVTIIGSEKEWYIIGIIFHISKPTIYICVFFFLQRTMKKYLYILSYYNAWFELYIQFLSDCAWFSIILTVPSEMPLGKCHCIVLPC